MDLKFKIGDRVRKTTDAGEGGALVRGVIGFIGALSVDEGRAHWLVCLRPAGAAWCAEACLEAA